MSKRLPLVLSSAAFVLALLGMTPLGEAAADLGSPRSSKAGEDSTGISGWQIVMATSTDVTSSSKIVSVTCPVKGKKVLGGGAFAPPSLPIVLKASYPSPTGDAWVARATASEGYPDKTWKLSVWAVCASLT